MAGRPTPAVWISTLLALLLCAMRFVIGVILVAQGAAERANPQQNALTSLLDPFYFDPIYAGTLHILLAAVLAWLQYTAVRRRSCVRSYIVGAAFLVLGVLACITPWEKPWDAAGYALIGAYLFIGISMLRWGRQLTAS
jgi:ABC-type sulfate transport system permease subunit